LKFPAKHSGDFEIVPAGNHVGICNAIADLGLQPGSALYPNPKHQVYIRFEIPSEQVTYQKDGKELTGPMSIGSTMTASMSEKANLRKFIESWFGKKFPSDDVAGDFDLKLLLGKRCLLNITHTEKGQKIYANVVNATPLPKGMASTEAQHNASIYFSLDAPDPNALSALPEWLRKKIEARLPDGADVKGQTVGGAGDPDDEIPF
jgi:hypothetical protein